MPNQEQVNASNPNNQLPEELPFLSKIPLIAYPLCFVLGLCLLAYVVSYTPQPVSQLTKFKRLHFGMPKEQVIRIMGQPVKVFSPGRATIGLSIHRETCIWPGDEQVKDKLSLVLIVFDNAFNNQAAIHGYYTVGDKSKEVLADPPEPTFWHKLLERVGLTKPDPMVDPYYMPLKISKEPPCGVGIE